MSQRGARESDWERRFRACVLGARPIPPAGVCVRGGLAPIEPGVRVPAGGLIVSGPLSGSRASNPVRLGAPFHGTNSSRSGGSPPCSGPGPRLPPWGRRCRGSGRDRGPGASRGSRCRRTAGTRRRRCRSSTRPSCSSREKCASPTARRRRRRTTRHSRGKREPSPLSTPRGEDAPDAGIGRAWFRSGP